ncbi:MAG TPA: ADP/ATP-dependent (S)-NAD(P)H-hydrate dehydratase [Pseudolysinimonas sp.]|nr:ADP/ATP-dependent (S)-NAD(P)H-hydrate dehydratase [Pseudolysinimonas sp.]
MAVSFGAGDARAWIAAPGPDDDKYSRGVLGFVTGSPRYPGAAVLGVDAALHAGVGMVRYLGTGRPTRLVLQRRPETVTAAGRVQAWVLGSGQDPDDRDDLTTELLERALGQQVPCVIDSGALGRVPDAVGPVVVTPHAGELAGLLGVDRDAVHDDPDGCAERAARELGVTVLLKGYRTRIATPEGMRYTVTAPTTWLATAGSGDALAGILGALVATHAGAVARDPRVLAELAATACVLHGLAGERASGGGPMTVLGLNAHLPAVIAELLTG